MRNTIQIQALTHRISSFAQFAVSLSAPYSQIEFVVDGSVPSDLTPTLVLTREELSRLEERASQLMAEKGEQKELYHQARQQHVRLIHDRKDMDVEMQGKTETQH